MVGALGLGIIDWSPPQTLHEAASTLQSRHISALCYYGFGAAEFLHLLPTLGLFVGDKGFRPRAAGLLDCRA